MYAKGGGRSDVVAVKGPLRCCDVMVLDAGRAGRARQPTGGAAQQRTWTTNWDTEVGRVGLTNRITQYNQ